MSELTSFLEFAMDLVCMMPPLDEIEATILSKDQAITLALGTLWVVCVLITAAAFKGNGFGLATSVLLGACITSVGFVGAGGQELIKTIFVAAYPPMVVVLRIAEGGIIGERASPYLRWWHSFVLLAIVIALYHILKPLPAGELILIKGCWAVLGVVLASLAWTHMMAKEPEMRHPLALLAAFAVFASTLVYVCTTGLERTLYQWAFPVGVLIGIGERRYSDRLRKDVPKEDD